MGIVDGTTSLLVHSALDALSQRHKVISNNIANVNTPGFAPKTLEFEKYLQKILLDTSGERGEADLIRDFERFEQKLMSGQMINTAKEATVELDIEMTRLTENLLRYQALLEGLNKRSAVLKMAISEGRV